jgi:hypothetical protein
VKTARDVGPRAAVRRHWGWRLDFEARKEGKEFYHEGGRLLADSYYSNGPLWGGGGGKVVRYTELVTLCGWVA